MIRRAINFRPAILCGKPNDFGHYEGRYGIEDTRDPRQYPAFRVLRWGGSGLKLQ